MSCLPTSVHYKIKKAKEICADLLHRDTWTRIGQLTRYVSGAGGSLRIVRVEFCKIWMLRRDQWQKQKRKSGWRRWIIDHRREKTKKPRRRTLKWFMRFETAEQRVRVFTLLQVQLLQWQTAFNQQRMPSLVVPKNPKMIRPVNE